MDWIKVVSSNISRFRYDPDTKVLEIEFHGSGLYQFFDVPIQLFEGLMNANSHGKYFNQNIKAHYRYERL